MKRRLIYLSLSVICISLCALIVIFFSRNGFIRGFVGDMLIVLLIFFFIRIFVNGSSWKLAVFTLAFSFAVEISQYFRVITIMGLEQSKVAQIILGNSFDARDLLAYALGTTIAYLIDVTGIRKKRVNKVNEKSPSRFRIR